MFAVPHPEVLAADWLPPNPMHRAREVTELAEQLHANGPPSLAPHLWVAGTEGSGTSTVARQAIRRFAADAPYEHRPSPRVLAARMRGSRGAAAVATTLLRQLDPGFVGRGFATAEIMTGFLRRIRREARPIVVLVDDLDSGSPPLEPLVAPFRTPDRYLPEGIAGLPPITVVVAGRVDTVRRARRAWAPAAALRELSPLAEGELRSIVADRFSRALGREGPVGLVASIVERARRDGRGASRALDLLRRELLGATALQPDSVYRPGPGSWEGPVERSLLEALRQLARTDPADLARVRERERELAAAQGRRPLASTTLWRRILRLEQTGYVQRTVRLGGIGGTRSLVRLLSPEGVSPRPIDIPRAYGSPAGAARPAWPLPRPG